ncbi:MAG TPA: D-alanyl-D-alanine carboxypeptidase family protein [Actinomycetota bacterium]|nr:D-alanyl-D-alanine carboxypeptidase family protein [Actinomycetota bacterium]
MTILLGCISLLTAVALSWGCIEVGGAALDRSNAQTAADAAALAAAAASAPGVAADPREAAALYAGLNDGRLLSCLCEPGATAVQVEVAVGSARAAARAVMDPTFLAPGSGTVAGLDPHLAQAVSVLIEAAHGAVYVESGFRSTQEQQALWAAALQRYGSAEAADDWVAPPGHSMHERGLAVDLGGDVEMAARLAGELGLPLHRPLANEPWHFELSGSR